VLQALSYFKMGALICRLFVCYGQCSVDSNCCMLTGMLSPCDTALLASQLQLLFRCLGEAFFVWKFYKCQGDFIKGGIF
jgi:hypothetical protein